MTIEIRDLLIEDHVPWLSMFERYLRFYRHDLDEATIARTFERLCRDEDGLHGVLALDGREPVGFAHLVFHASTWTQASYCYLEDLWVEPHGRGTRAGERLIDHAYRFARGRGASRVYWHTQQFNGPARSLYDAVASPTSLVVYEHELEPSS